MVAFRLAAFAAAGFSFAAHAAKTSPSTAQETLNVLDKDGSGWVELEEIQEFARSQGLTDASSVLAEFQGLDRDGNGKLDASELEGMLALSDEAPAEPTNAAMEASVSLPEVPSMKPMPALPEASVPEPTLPQVLIPEVNSFVGSRPRAAAQDQFGELQQQQWQQPQQWQQQQQPQPQRQQTDMQRVTEMPPMAPLPQPVAPQAAAPQLAEAPARVFAAAPTLQGMVKNTTTWLEESAFSAERIAIRAAAEVFARHAQEVLTLRGQEEQQATKLETFAKQLRQQEEDIMSTAASLTQDAAKKAVDAEIQHSLGSIKEMEETLHKTEALAAQKHKIAEEAMSRTLKSQAALSDSMRRMRGSI